MCFHLNWCLFFAIDITMPAMDEEAVKPAGGPAPPRPGPPPSRPAPPPTRYAKLEIPSDLILLKTNTEEQTRFVIGAMHSSSHLRVSSYKGQQLSFLAK